MCSGCSSTPRWRPASPEWMVVEELGADRVAMSGCPLVEGAVVATIDALGGMSRDEILDALAKVGETPKF